MDNEFEELEQFEEDFEDFDQEEIIEDNSHIYKNFGLIFTLAGLASLVVGVAEQVFKFNFFSGSVYGLSLFLLIIGVVMYRTN
ncbi:MAG TPA: hypothetical protein ENK21_02090 [Trueperaceae bacterium]|nr:hypothetical protein [Trueperaceae bacterium]